MVAALPILKSGCCWRVGNGESIKVYLDKWIPNCTAHRILQWGQDADREMLVSELIDAEIIGWRRDIIMDKFSAEEAAAICKIPLSRRNIADSLVWLHTKNGKYSVKSGYHVARKVMRNDDGVESSVGCRDQQIWKQIWQLHVPNKIKIFWWRACQDILPTRVNLARRKIISETGCQCCIREPESVIHAVWECEVAQDVWAGCAIKVQKCKTYFPDIVALFEYVLDRFAAAEVEVFLVQAWLLWNQRNTIIHGGQMRDLKWLNQRALEYLDEYRNVQVQMDIPNAAPQSEQSWKPPPSSLHKLNFDVAVFEGTQSSGFGAIIRSSTGEVMAAMSVKGPSVNCSEEAEALACRKALEFAVESGFTEMIIEGDNVAVMRAVASTPGDLSLLGHVYEDIKCSIRGLLFADISCVKRGGNKVAHILARYARNIDNELYWMEDSPPFVLDALYQDCLNMNE